MIIVSGQVRGQSGGGSGSGWGQAKVTFRPVVNSQLRGMLLKGQVQTLFWPGRNGKVVLNK